MSDYEIFDFSEVARALREIRTQYMAGANPFNDELSWTGPERLHFHVAATSPEPAWHFSAEGMLSHADQGHDFWDVYTMVTLQIGFHNGVVRMEPDLAAARSHADSYRRMLMLANKNREEGGGLSAE